MRDVLTAEERSSYSSSIIFSLLCIMIDGYEEYGEARTRTSEPNKSNETPQHVPQGVTPHSVCPGSLVTHCGVLTTLNMVARSPCNYLVHLSCRLVYALLRANPLNVVVLEAFDVIQGLYGSLAGLVAKCCKLQQKNEKILVKRNRHNGENARSGIEKSEMASNFPSSSSNIDPSPSTDIVGNRVPISVNTVPNPVIQNSSASTSTSTPTTNSNSKKNKMMETNMNINTNNNSNLETKTDKESKLKTKDEIKNKNGTYDLHAGCTDLVPLILDVTCVLQYVAVVTSERGDNFLRFLLHLVVSMSITPATSSSSCYSCSSSSFSSSVPFNQARGRNETKENNNNNNNNNQKQNRVYSDGNVDKNMDSKTVIIDPGPIPLFDPLISTLQLFPFLRTYQYSQYVTDCDSSERESLVRKGEEKIIVGIKVEREEEREAGMRKNMTINTEEEGAKIVKNKKIGDSKQQKEEENVRTGEGAYVTKDSHIDQNDSHSDVKLNQDEKVVGIEVGSKEEKKVESNGETVGDGDAVEDVMIEVEDDGEMDKEEEVEECHKEEVLCVLLFALKGSVDDTIVSTACSY